MLFYFIISQFNILLISKHIVGVILFSVQIEIQKMFFISSDSSTSLK